MIIEASSLEIGYGEALVVEDMDIQVKKGEITTIIGPNGSGKSTVLKALARLIKYRGGQVCVNGRSLLSYGNKELAKLIGILPQKHDAPPDYKVKDLVGYGRMPYQKWHAGPKQEDEEIIRWAMEVTGVARLSDKSIQDCSGGEAQQVWISMVLAQKPEILFLDEPTTYLDISHQLETIRLVKKLKKETGIGVVMVLHDLSQAMEASDWIVVMKGGRKYSEGTPKEVITSKMMKEVYHVDCSVIHVPGRSRPLLAFKEIL